MIKSARILQPIMVEFENESKVFFMDSVSQKIIDNNMNLVEEHLELEIFSRLGNETYEELLPLQEISKVMNIEKKLAEENDKHIFRRS